MSVHEGLCLQEGPYIAIGSLSGSGSARRPHCMVSYGLNKTQRYIDKQRVKENDVVTVAGGVGVCE